MRLPRRKLLCPFCGGIFPAENLRTHEPYTCPHCLRQLQWSRRRLNVSGIIAVLVTASLCYGFGIRGWRLVPATILLWFPVLVVSDYALSLLVRLRFEAYEPKRSHEEEYVTRLFPR